jgi:hypothetical protein
MCYKVAQKLTFKSVKSVNSSEGLNYSYSSCVVCMCIDIYRTQLNLLYRRIFSVLIFRNQYYLYSITLLSE